MVSALQTLGYSGVYHMLSVFKNPPDAWMWREALAAQAGKRPPFTREDWDQLLGNVQCALDVPVVAVLPSLIEAYPEAKVIIWERDVDSWYRSMESTVIKHVFHPIVPLLWLLDRDHYRPIIGLQATMSRALFGPKRFEEQNAKRVYRDIFARIRRIVPEERKLEFQLEEGWEPLCKFLRKEIPDEPFPRIHERETWVERVYLLRRLAIRRVIRRLMPYTLAFVGVICGIAWFKIYENT